MDKGGRFKWFPKEIIDILHQFISNIIDFQATQAFLSIYEVAAELIKEILHVTKIIVKIVSDHNP